MNQVLKNFLDLTVTFTWLPSDNKVYVKYYLHSKEIDSFDRIHPLDAKYFHDTVDRFFEQSESFNLIKWSY